MQDRKIRSFLPEDYEAPKKMGGSYTKLQDGSNRFRILSAAVTGYEYFNTENKPVRTKTYPNAVIDIKKDGKIKHFWAFAVWNYTEKKVQILEITQASIRDALHELQLNEDWGEPFGYDITITKSGKDLETKYTVQPSPHKPVPAEAKEAFAEVTVDLTALFRGEHPITEGCTSKGAPDEAPDQFEQENFKPEKPSFMNAPKVGEDIDPTDISVE